MLEELKKYLNDYSKEIDEQPQQEYEKSLRNLWKRNAELAIKIYGILNVRYMSLYRIEDIPEEHRGSYSSRANCAFDAMELIVSAEHFSKDRPSDIVADRGYSLDALKSILSKDYSPPEEIEDTINHLSTLRLLYAHLMPTIPGLSHIIPLKAGYALALLVGSASIKSFLADDKGFKGDRAGSSNRIVQARKEEMWDLAAAVFLMAQKKKGKKRTGRKPTVTSVRDNINTAFRVLHKTGELKELPDHLKELIKHEELIKRVYKYLKEDPRRRDPEGVPRVSPDTVRRGLKDRKLI